MTSYLKSTVAPVSRTYNYKIRYIFEYVLRNLLQTYKNINRNSKCIMSMKLNRIHDVEIKLRNFSAHFWNTSCILYYDTYFYTCIVIYTSVMVSEKKIFYEILHFMSRCQTTGNITIRSKSINGTQNRGFLAMRLNYKFRIIS